MDSFEQRQRRQEARRRLLAQRNRAGRLRGQVIAVSLVCFVLLWIVVCGQMLTGNDPVLGEKARALMARPDESSRARAVPEISAQPGPQPQADPEPEPESAPEAELEPLTTGQS